MEVFAMCVAGARPNFVKIKPVIEALERRSARVCFVHTGQHYDQSMSGIFLEELGLRRPDVCLDVGSGSHADQTGRTMMALEPLVTDLEPDVVVVVGDVNSTLAAALVAAKAPTALAHVEAGLRSRDWSMPEEVNRVATDSVSDFLFAPSPDAADNLLAEGRAAERVHVVGNAMIDTLLANLPRARARPVLASLGLSPGEYGVVTLHRPANVDEPEQFGRLVDALAAVASDCPLVFPAHPRTQSALRRLGELPHIAVVEPLGYLDFLALEAGAKVVLTDSGGVQEETTVLGVPCLTLREVTERPITVSEGTNAVVGRDPRTIVEVARRVLREGVPPRRPALWDGRAGERIADVLLKALA